MNFLHMEVVGPLRKRNTCIYMCKSKSNEFTDLFFF